MTDWLKKLFGNRGPMEPVPQKPKQSDAYPPLPIIDATTAPSQGFAQPHFRFFPGAYQFGKDGEAIFKREEGPCHCCKKRDIYAYQLSVYWLRRDKPTLCAQCIADGRLDELLYEGDHYGMHDWQADGPVHDEETVQEVDKRTPGFDTYNPFMWATLDGEPMAFMGYGDEEKWKYVPEALAAMREANDGKDAFPSPYFLLFKQVSGERYRVTIDLC